MKNILVGLVAVVAILWFVVRPIMVKADKTEMAVDLQRDAEYEKNHPVYDLDTELLLSGRCSYAAYEHGYRTKGWQSEVSARNGGTGYTGGTVLLKNPYPDEPDVECTVGANNAIASVVQIPY